MRSASGWSAAICESAAAKPFFERFLGGAVRLGVPWPRRLPGQVEVVHQLCRSQTSFQLS
jgi:hypothetical protein